MFYKEENLQGATNIKGNVKTNTSVSFLMHIKICLDLIEQNYLKFEKNTFKVIC